LQPLQKFCHGVLRRIPCFEFIGRPESEWSINEIFAMQKVGAWFLSGDYKDATNEMFSWPSEVFVDVLFDLIYEERDSLGWAADDVYIYRTLTLNSLTQHILDCRASTKGDLSLEEREKLTLEGKIVPQKNGQLMGSIMSFITLCIANAAGCRYAQEINERRKIRLNKASMKINGDDNVLSDPHGTLFPIWEGVLKMFGFISSLGKTYHSPMFLTVNSRLYVREVDGSFTQAPFSKLSLVHGKSKDGSESKDLWEMGSLLKKVKESCLPEHYQTLVHEFLRYNSRKFAKCPVLIFLPTWLGGLGVQPPDGYWLTKDGILVRKIATLMCNGLVKKVKLFPLDPTTLLWNVF